MLMLGRADEAVSIARDALATCNRVDLGLEAQRSIERVLGLAEAATGAVEQGLTRLHHLREAAETAGIDGVPLGQLHETLARACIYASDQEGFHSAAARAAEKYCAGGSPALHAKHERLLQAGRSAGFATDSMLPRAGGAHEAFDNLGVGTELAAVTDPQERPRTALRMMMERSCARAGFLFLWESEALQLAASASDCPPSAEMVGSLTEYFRAELDGQVDVTVTCFDRQLAEGEEPGFGTSEGIYRPILLSHMKAQRSVVVGVAAILDGGEGFRLPDPGMVSMISEELRIGEDNEEAVSVFDLG